MNIFKKALNIIKQFNNWRLKKQALRVLIKRYKFDYEVELVLEKWIIKRILDGQIGRRPELAEKQQRLKEIKMFIEYFSESK